MKKQRTQYHPPMCASLELEFREDKKELVFKTEHKLNTQANSVDFLILKSDGIKTKSSLGHIFKKVNLVEYRSPDDKLGVKVLYRTKAYACLYIAYSHGDYRPEDFTITFIRERKPRILMEYLKERGYEIREHEPGMYYVSKTDMIMIQILVTRLLKAEHKWITKLTKHVEESDVVDLMDETKKLSDDKDKMNAESVWNLILQLNQDKKWMEEMIGMGALRDLFQPEFDRYEERLKSKDEEIQSRDEEIRRTQEENNELKKIIEKMKKQMAGNVAGL